jgi:hypothetical protein
MAVPSCRYHDLRSSYTSSPSCGSSPCNPADCRRYNGNIGDHPVAAKSLSRTPNPAPAEAASLTAIAVAQQQNARSFALSLARLYRATGRDADARAALWPALEGFSPTQEFAARPSIVGSRRGRRAFVSRPSNGRYPPIAAVEARYREEICGVANVRATVSVVTARVRQCSSKSSSSTLRGRSFEKCTPTRGTPPPR